MCVVFARYCRCARIAEFRAAERLVDFWMRAMVNIEVAWVHAFFRYHSALMSGDGFKVLENFAEYLPASLSRLRGMVAIS